MNQIESKSIYNGDVPEDVQRESALEDSALRIALSKLSREVKGKLSKTQKRAKPLIQGHGRHL